MGGKMDFEYCTCMGKLKKNFQRRLNESINAYSISSAHAIYISTLYKFGDLSLKQLTDYISVDKANTTRIINDLNTKKIIIKKINNNHTTISLTEKGLLIDKKIEILIQEIKEEMLKKITKEEEIEFKRILKKIMEE